MTSTADGQAPRARSRGHRSIHVAVLLAALCGVSPAMSCLGSPPAVLRIVRNGELSDSMLPVRFQPLDEPQLDALAAREHLRDVVSPVTRQFDRILRLKDWVAAQWPHSTPNPTPPWNAMTILDWIRAGKTGGFCGQYAQVFLQSLAALGFTARYVEIGSRDDPYAHYVTDVWSNDFDKWVMMDPDYNVYFERGGVPLSVREIHDALMGSTLADVRFVLGDVRAGHPSPESWPQRTAELYYYVRYHLKADHLTRPDEPPFDRFNDMIEFHDARVVPWETSLVHSPYPKERLTARQTSDRAAPAAKINQVHVDVVRVSGRTAELALRNNVLQFDRYEYRDVDAAGDAGPWHALHGSTLEWTMPPAGGTLDVRGVNVRGVPGPMAILAAGADQAASQTD